MERNENEVEDLMNKTYPTQRYFINHMKSTIRTLKENWPFLMEEECFLRHCNKLLGMEIMEVFSDSFKVTGKKMYDFMLTMTNKSIVIKNCLSRFSVLKRN